MLEKLKSVKYALRDDFNSNNVLYFRGNSVINQNEDYY